MDIKSISSSRGIICAVITFAVVSSITLFVIGILGSTGQIPMALPGSRAFIICGGVWTIVNLIVAMVLCPSPNSVRSAYNRTNLQKFVSTDPLLSTMYLPNQDFI